MNKSKFYRKLTEAISNGISNAISDDDLFDNDEPLSPMEDVKDVSVYANHSKYACMFLCLWEKLKSLHENGKAAECVDMDMRDYFTELLFCKNRLDSETLMLMEKHDMVNLFFECCADVGQEKDGYRRILMCDEYNYIGTDGRLISKEWFFRGNDFSEGFAVVDSLNRKSNYIGTDGDFLLEDGYDECYDFNEGYAAVGEGYELYNFIDKRGEIISGDWFMNFMGFNEGYAVVQEQDATWYFMDGQCNYIDTDFWISECRQFCGGYAAVARLCDDDSVEWNFINYDGECLSDVWFDSCWDFENGMAEITLHGNRKHIDKQGNIID